MCQLTCNLHPLQSLLCNLCVIFGKFHVISPDVLEYLSLSFKMVTFQENKELERLLFIILIVGGTLFALSRCVHASVCSCMHVYVHWNKPVCPPTVFLCRGGETLGLLKAARSLPFPLSRSLMSCSVSSVFPSVCEYYLYFICIKKWRGNTLQRALMNLAETGIIWCNVNQNTE